MAMVNGMLEPGNVIVSQPYYISGKSGALTVPAAASPLATLVHFGRVDPNITALILSPLRVAAARAQFMVTSGAAATVGFELYKGASSAQRTTGGNLRLPVPRKTLGYPAIAATETSLYIADTGAISGGNFTPEGDPLIAMGCATAATFGFAQCEWKPADGVPVSLEAGQAMEWRVTQAASGVGILLVQFDILRQ